MSQPNAQSGSHDNPYGTYTQDHENWNNQAEQMRKRAQLDQDLANMRQQEQQEANRVQQQQRRQEQQRAQTHKKVQPQKKGQSKPRKTSGDSERTPWSNGWALIGSIVGAGVVYPRANGMEDQWWAIGFAAVLAGVLAGRFYKVIVFMITVAVVLALGVLAMSVWGNWGQ